MKTLSKILGTIGVVLMTFSSYAQNYKAPAIEASGKMTDTNGKHIGNVSKEGVITNAEGTKIAYVDSEGFLIDAATGKKMGKGEKNGNFTPYYESTPDKGWTTSAPMNGTCYVKDKDGNVKAVVHENYKQFGACAAHCMENYMDHNKNLDKEKSGEYTCGMHPDVKSDNPGKCPKCGMELTKPK